MAEEQDGSTDDLGPLVSEFASHVGTAVMDLITYSIETTEKWFRSGYDLKSWTDDAHQISADMIDRSTRSVQLVGHITRSITGHSP